MSVRLGDTTQSKRRRRSRVGGWGYYCAIPFEQTNRREIEREGGRGVKASVGMQCFVFLLFSSSLNEEETERIL